MPQQISLLAIVIGLAIVLPLVLLFGAVLLRAGISLYNRFVGGPESPKAVPEPSFNKAMKIVLLVGVINMLIGAASELTLELVLDAGQLNSRLIEGLQGFASFAIGIMVMAAVLQRMLPTRPGRAIGASLCHTLACCLFAGVILAVAFSVSVVAAAIM